MANNIREFKLTSQELIKPSGRYVVGNHKVDLFDKDNPELAYPGGRLIPLQLYFPIGAGGHKPYPKVFEARAPKDFSSLDVNGFSKPVSIEALASGAHPIVIFNHGHHVAMTDYANINEELASHGYIVVSIQHQLDTDIKQKSYLVS